MSSKNKLENKSIRCSQRAAVSIVARTPVSPIAQKTSARLLSDPKQKLTANRRRRLQASRGLALGTVPSGGYAPAVKVALRLEALPMVKLIRRLKQAARRASTCKHLLEALHAGSKFGPAIAAEQTHQLSLCGQIVSEITTRNHTKSQPATTPNNMLKHINKILKIIGLNLVHAKKAKRAGYRFHASIEDAKTDAKCIPSPTCCADEYNAGKAHVDASPTQDNNITGQSS